MGPKLRSDDDIMEKLHDITDKLVSIQSSVDSVKTEMKILTSQVTSHEAKLEQINTVLNEQEQRNRNFSLRIHNLKLSSETMKSANKTSEYVYTAIIKPILTIAVTKNEIGSVPPLLSTIEYAHHLPAPKKSPDLSTVIVRLSSRLIRQAVFKGKKEFFSQNPEFPNVFISEDLTRHNHT